MRTYRKLARRCGGVILILAALLLTDAAGAQDLSRRERLRVLVVRPGEDRRFFDIQPTGALDGFDYELVRGFAALHRLRIEAIQVESWGALVPALLKGTGDVIAGGCTASVERAKQIDFTDEVFPTRSVVVTWGKRPPVLSVQQLRKARVGTLEGSAMVGDLQRAGVPDAQIALFPTIVKIDEALRAGHIDASAEPIEATFFSSRLADLHVGMYLGKPQSLAFGVRKDDPELRLALSTYLSNARRSGSWAQLIVKYFGAESLTILNRARESP